MQNSKLKNSRLKNSIVLRGIASNIVDEAIVILKPNIKIKSKEILKGKCFEEKKTQRSLIVHEAEHIILEYMNKIDRKKIMNEKIKVENKNKALKISNIIFIIAFILSVFG